MNSPLGFIDYISSVHPHPSPDLERHPTLPNVGDRVLSTTIGQMTTDEHSRRRYTTPQQCHSIDLFVFDMKHFFQTIKLHTKQRKCCARDIFIYNGAQCLLCENRKQSAFYISCRSDAVDGVQRRRLVVQRLHECRYTQERDLTTHP